MKLDKKAIWLFWLKNFLVCIVCSVVIVAVSPSLLKRVLVIIAKSYIYRTFLLLWIKYGGFYLLFVGGVSWVAANLQYNAFSFTIEQERLVIKKGVLFKKVIAIPFSRVQNVDITRNPLCQLLGLSEVVVQTAGISGVWKAEGRLPGVTTEKAEGLRDQIMAGAQNPQGF